MDKTPDFFFLALLFLCGETSKQMLILHLVCFWFVQIERTSLGSEKAAIDCEWLFPWLLPSPWALPSCFCFCLAALLRSEHFLPSLRLTFYLWRDGQRGAYQQGQQHFSLCPLLWLNKRGGNNKPLENLRWYWMNRKERTRLFFVSF